MRIFGLPFRPLVDMVCRKTQEAIVIHVIGLIKGYWLRWNVIIAYNGCDYQLAWSQSKHDWLFPRLYSDHDYTVRVIINGCRALHRSLLLCDHHVIMLLSCYVICRAHCYYYYLLFVILPSYILHGIHISNLVYLGSAILFNVCTPTRFEPKSPPLTLTKS